jgi:hypothetical protein
MLAKHSLGFGVWRGGGGFMRAGVKKPFLRD